MFADRAEDINRFSLLEFTCMFNFNLRKVYVNMVCVKYRSSSAIVVSVT